MQNVIIRESRCNTPNRMEERERFVGRLDEGARRGRAFLDQWQDTTTTMVGGMKLYCVQ